MIELADIGQVMPSLGAFVAGISGAVAFIRRTDIKADLDAAKAASEGLTKLLTEVISASSDNTLTMEEIAGVITAAADIPKAVKLALKKSTTTQTTTP